MTNNGKMFAAGIMSLLVGLGAGGAAIGAATDPGANGADGQQAAIEDQIDFSSGPVQCEIAVRKVNGVVMLENRVHTLEDISGTYSVRVSSYGNGNRSSIRQGGYFQAGADSAKVLGMMQLGNRGATYDIELSIEADGHALACNESFKV
ncbi:MAG TPA: hypothetical protein ENJ68_01135 [Devosia sp.]|nr:hypothetical protein [Devosia sp.]